MQLFVDILDHAGTYRACRAPAYADPALPPAVLAAALFEDATDCRIYHVESGRYLDGESLGRAGELDTLVLVTGTETAPHQVQALWCSSGGPARRQLHVYSKHAGGMEDCAPGQRDRFWMQ